MTNNFLQFKDTEPEGEGVFMQMDSKVHGEDSEALGSWKCFTLFVAETEHETLTRSNGFFLVGMTISNWAEQIDPQGHCMAVSVSKECTEFDKRKLQQD